MWTQQQLAQDLVDIGLPSGSVVLVHAAISAIGPIDGGPETLIAALQETLGPAGTLLVPTFALAGKDRAASGDSMPSSAASRESLEREALPPLEQAPLFAPSYWTNEFAEAMRRHPSAVHSEHPAFSFAALGAEAEALVASAPFHYPLGSDGPLARLHQRNGWILLIGLGHTQNISLHLAEIWANVPYVHRTLPVVTATGAEVAMLGSPECSAGFPKIEPVLRQSRILRRGYIGNAESQLMRQQQTVSMAIAMLQGSPSALLCEDENCRACNLARRMSKDQVVEPI